jgi:pimeloyl-ACP methyl ester carboxylesterase
MGAPPECGIETGAGESMVDGSAMTPGSSPAGGLAEVNGIRMAYRVWRGPRRVSHPPVVLLHGLLQSGEGMNNLAAHLARRGPVLVPDLRGRGGSDQPDGGYDPATMADDVAALMREIGFAPAVAIGRLHGGLVAYHLAARHPELVSGLVLGDTSPEVSAARAERMLGFIRSLPRRFETYDDAVAFYEGPLGLSAARARHDIPSDLQQDGDAYVWRHNIGILEKIEAASEPRSDWAVLEQIRCPALLLRGQRGEVSPEMAERFRQAIQGCQVQTILGSRHDVFLGPGAEQAFGAVGLFLLRLSGAADDPSQLALPGTSRPEPSQLVLVGDIPLQAEAVERNVIERTVGAINGRDDRVVEALFLPDGRFTLVRPDGAREDGGVDAARSALYRLLDAYPGATVSARQAVLTEESAAAVLTVRSPGVPGEALLLPTFFEVRDGRISLLTIFTVRPA